MEGWTKTDRGWVKRYGPPPSQVQPGDYPCPSIATDAMPLTEHVDGRHYDSKSAFRAVTKARGYEEIGNDTARFKADAPKRDTSKLDAAIHRAIAQNA